MDKYVDARFERVEKALATLVESITKYTPQASQASDLAAADRELARGLRQLEAHQGNHARLESLRAASSALDAQIRDTLRTLWTTRRDITSTATTVFPDGPQYGVNYEELLSYARRISKMTMPPPSIIASYGGGIGAGAAGDDNSAVSTGEAVNTPTTTTTAAPPTPLAGGSTTPNPNAMVNGGGAAAAAAAAPQSQPQGGGSQGAQATANSSGSTTTATTALPTEWTQFLDPLTGHVFVPWARDEKVRVGALASIQHLLERGIDPRGYDPAEEEARRQREEEERRGQEEREAREREENLRRMREEQARVARERQLERERALEEAQRRGSTGAAGPGPGPSPVAPGPSAEPQKRQFQFMGGDLDDDDDD